MTIRNGMRLLQLFLNNGGVRLHLWCGMFISAKFIPVSHQVLCRVGIVVPAMLLVVGCIVYPLEKV